MARAMGNMKPRMRFWAVTIIFILWGLAGAFACYGDLTISAAQLALLPTDQRDAYTAMPDFAKVAYIIAVGGGLVGSILLLLRWPSARIAYIVSLVGIIIQFGWFFIPYQGMAKAGASSAIFPAFICAMGVFQIWFTAFEKRSRWLT